MNFSAEKELRFLLMHMDAYIDSFIYEILHDSEEEPEKSAVALNNVIKSMPNSSSIFLYILKLKMRFIR